MMSMKEYCLRYRKPGQTAYFTSYRGNVVQGRVSAIYITCITIVWESRGDPTYYYYDELPNWKELTFTC